MKSIGTYAKHMENGSGIEIIIAQDDWDNDRIHIRMKAAHSGHPTVTADLDGANRLNAEELRRIGDVFHFAAETLRKQKNAKHQST